jgi:hypothetical protein
MSKRNSLLSSTVLSGVSGVFIAALTGHTAYAQSMTAVFDKVAFASVAPKFSGPAVDGINGKIGAFGGSLGRTTGYGVEGSLQFPVAHAFGLQLDPRVGSVGGHTYGEIGAHLFWRNPGAGLLGLYVNHVRLDRFGGVHATAIAGEGEYYWGRWTLQGVAGVEFGNSVSSSTSISDSGPSGGGTLTSTSTFIEGFDVKTRFFDQINLKYYMTDNWSGYVGHRYLGGKHAMALGTEFALPIDPKLSTTMFAEARVGHDDFSGIWGGMKFYFGHQGKSLIKRNRENDDPNNWSNIFTLLNSAQSSGSSASSLSCPPGEIPVDGVCVGGGGGE